ncbi:hypothetical protein CSB37_03660 [bacterium DOLZORAL124_38_8]|nr:MAG: hypothetical protein CSB37_03660 [bacterium DOLZORAL124_38_8]
MIERTCRQSGEKFEITKADLKFYAKMGVITAEQFEKLSSFPVDESVSISEEKIPQELLVGLPTLCPAERQRRRLMFFNIHNLYKNNTLISPHAPEYKLNVISKNDFLNEKDSGLNYGRNFDFSRPFFEQFKELQIVSPRWDRMSLNAENSNWTTNSISLKNCYLVYSSTYLEDCLYCDRVDKSSDVVDCEDVKNSELCYGSLFLENCFEVLWSKKIKQSTRSAFLQDCRNCSHCICCVGLKNKEYQIFNKPVSPEVFEETWNKLLRSSAFRADLWKKFKQGCVLMPQKNLEIVSSDNCVGNNIFNCKNAWFSYEVKDCEDIKFVQNALRSKDTMDCTNDDESELSFENAISFDLYNSKFNFTVAERCINLEYSETCLKCQDCFGCVGLINKQYCIFNRQYEQKEYFELRAKIIEHMKKTGEWGEFFPAELSPFAYNETAAQVYFPLTQEEAEKRGYRWRDDQQSVQYTGPKYEISEDIADVPDEVVNQVLECERSGKFYRIQKRELDFYRKMNLPIPRLHPDERHKDRMALRNPRKLWQRTCADCGCKIQTTFAPDRPEKILCEACYLKVVD